MGEGGIGVEEGEWSQVSFYWLTLAYERNEPLGSLILGQKLVTMGGIHWPLDMYFKDQLSINQSIIIIVVGGAVMVWEFPKVRHFIVYTPTHL